MPLLPLPSSTTLAGGDLPVSDTSDVLGEFPRPQRNAAVAPVRDAFVEGFTASFIEYQSQAERAAAQCDALRATGDYLRDKADEHDVRAARGESEESLRSRIFATPDIVTPDTIEAAVNALIAPKTCRVTELDLDGWFVHSDAPAVWDSFVGAVPNYPDRYYDDLPGATPLGCVPTNNLPRSFHIDIPILDAADGNFAFVTEDQSFGPYFGADAYIFADSSTADELYDAIVGRVQAIKGQGMSWSLLTDSRL